MTILTVFRSRLRADAYENGYGERAEEMLVRAKAMPGFVSFKAFTADDGERVSIVEFSDRATHDAWAYDEEHRLAQHQGRTSFYTEYHTTVAEVSGERHWRPE